MYIRPAFFCKHAFKEQMVDGFLFSTVTHDAYINALDVEMSSAQHSLGVEAIYQNQLSKEFNTRGASKLPNDLEDQMCIHILEYTRIETP